MQNQFWLEKWQRSELGFHLQNPHPLLVKFESEIFNGADKVFVPLCGKTNDLRYLAEQDYFVLGSELSEIAVTDFFAEQSLTFNKIEGDTLNAFSNTQNELDITIWQGDFFQLTSAHCGPIKAIYDRAALVALPKPMRKQYVQQLKNLMRNGDMLLITLDYDDSQMAGPPFSVGQSEVAELFEFAKVELLSRKDIIDKEPKFAERGLDEFFESAWHIQWSE